MNQVDIQNVRDMFDHLFLSNQGAKSDEIFTTLQATGLEGLAAIIDRNKRNGFFVNARPLLDLVEVSLFMYSTLDSMPVVKKVELPETNGNYKFIIAGVNTRRDRSNTEKPYMIMLATPQSMHVDIAKGLAERHKDSSHLDSLGVGFAEAIKDFKIRVIAGGRIAVDHDQKDLQANKSSGNYGPLSNELVERFLEPYKALGYTVGVDMDNQGRFGQYDEE